jgi:hypothetical protein
MNKPDPGARISALLPTSRLSAANIWHTLAAASVDASSAEPKHLKA